MEETEQNKTLEAGTERIDNIKDKQDVPDKQNGQINTENNTSKDKLTPNVEIEIIKTENNISDEPSEDAENEIISFKKQISDVSSLTSDENDLFYSQDDNFNSDSEENLGDESPAEVKLERLLSKAKKYKDLVLQLKGENKALQTKIVSIEELCQLYQTQKINLQKQVKSLNNKNTQLQDEIHKLKAENYNNLTNNEELASIQKENERLLEKKQKISDKYYELKIQTRNQQHSKNIEIKEQLLEITRLQSELQKKNDEINDIKKSNDRTVKKLQQEIDRLKMNEEDLLEDIKNLEQNQKVDSSEVSDENPFPSNKNNSELKKQNEILKRKNDLISQNFELERIELQTLLEQKESQVKALTMKLNTKSNEPQNHTGSSKSLELLRTENKQLKEKLLTYKVSNTSAFTPAYLSDKFKAKSSKLNLTIFRLFSKINTRISSMNSKVSLLEYRLKLKKKRKSDLINNQVIYNIHYTPQRTKRVEALI